MTAAVAPHVCDETHTRRAWVTPRLTRRVDCACASRSAQVKRTVEDQSVHAFGTKLTAEPLDSIPLRKGGVTVADVDSLFKGKGKHVLMERKLSITSTSVADAVIRQVQKTAKAYKDLNKHVEDGVPSEVECIVYAEAMSLEAEAAIRGAGIYVLRHSDMGVLAPFAPAPAPTAHHGITRQA